MKYFVVFDNDKSQCWWVTQGENKQAVIKEMKEIDYAKKNDIENWIIREITESQREKLQNLPPP